LAKDAENAKPKGGTKKEDEAKKIARGEVKAKKERLDT